MADKPSQKAPDGKWAMPDKEITSALGQFIMAWSLVESTIEVAIGKELGLKALESSVVTAGMQFMGRSSTLLSLLKLHPLKHAKAIEIVNKMQEIGDRNDILHSVIGGSQNLIWFNRRTTRKKFASRIENYDRKRLLEVTVKCADLSTELMRNLGITSADYTRFFQDSHNAANKA